MSETPGVPQEGQPVVPVNPGPTVPLKWFLIVLAVAIVGWISAGFSTYSWKQVVDKYSKSTDVSGSTEVDKTPMEVGGKIVYQTVTKTVHDVKTLTVHDKTTTIIKSGCTLGGCFSLSSRQPGAYVVPDLLGFGPGNIQGLGEVFQGGEVVVGVGYRLNFSGL